MTCERNYSDAFNLLANVQDLDICSIFTCNKIDFETLRSDHSAG